MTHWRHPLLLMGMAIWLGAALAWLIGSGIMLAALLTTFAAAVAWRAGRSGAALVLVALCAGALTVLSHLHATRPELVRDWSAQSTAVSAVAVVQSCQQRGSVDIGARPRVRTVASARAMSNADVSITSRVPLVLLSDASALACLPRGSTVTVAGRLLPMADIQEPGVAMAVDALLGVAGPRGWPALVASSHDRMWAALSGIDPAAAALIAGLAVGDDTRAPPALADAMRDSGLSHLTAVSGGNVAVVLALVVGTAAVCGARLRLRACLGLAAIWGYGAYVGPEPSVLRASVMGGVAVLGTMRGGARGGFGLLGLAIAALIVARPGLTISWGFALSVAATAGILALAPTLDAGLSRTMPRVHAPAVAAVAVTLAAQVATAPLIAAMTGTISLTAVPANLAAAPLVAPITVLGLAVAASSAFAPGPASMLAHVAEPFGMALAGIARWAAGVPAGTLAVPSGALGAAAAAGGLLLVLAGYRWRGPPAACAVAAALTVSLGVLARPAQPPGDWIAAACDIGQGDAFLVRTAPNAALLIDTGPDSDALQRCLRQMGVDRIDLLVLTHFDTDHVAATPSVLQAFRPAAVLISPVALPARNAEAVRECAADHGTTVMAARPGQRMTVGGVVLTVVWPRRVIRSGSVANNAAVATSIEAGGLRMLFTGDLEPLGQAGLMAALAARSFDVTTIPHHGSANQNPGFLAWTGADVAWVSAGRGNHFGHPRAEALKLAAAAGLVVGRTDRDGTLALVARDGSPRLVALGPSP